MKILVIQLTRAGDIFCTWPTLSALRRKYPQAELHLLVRKKFYDAAQDFYVVDHLWKFDSEKIFEPLIVDPQNLNGAYKELLNFVDNLKQQNFDQIINLSYSPSSSYITHLAAIEKTIVKGYSRTSDFYLYIPDEASRYFKSHVGLDKSNRIHVVDLFAMTAQVDLEDADLKLYKFNFSKSGVVCHLGASQKQKTWPKEKWKELISILLNDQTKVMLVGGKDDFELAEYITQSFQNKDLYNFVGKTTFRDLARIISSAEFFIGGDSGPMHVANVVGTKIINLSVGNVQFWETGPLVPGSSVLRAQNPENLSFKEVYFAIKNKSSITCDGKKAVRYDDQGSMPLKGWPTIMWINFGGPVPVFSQLDQDFLKKIIEVCDIATKEINKHIAGEKAQLTILDQLDQILQTIAKTNPVLEPLVDYYFTDKSNILPGEPEQIAQETHHCYQWLSNMAKKGCFNHDGKLLENTGSK